MSDRTPPPPRRRIAGETPVPASAQKTPAPAKRPRVAPRKPRVAPRKPLVARPAARRGVPTGEVVAPAAGSSARTASPPPSSQVARPAARPERARASRFAVATVAVATVVLVAGAVVSVLGFRHFAGASLEDARSSAVTAASSATETIFSFSYDALDEHTTDSKAVMTPSFAQEFDVIAPALTDIAPDRKVQVTAVVRNAAALPCGDECSTSAISVLVFLDQDRRLADDDTSTVFGNRVEVDMVKSDGEWLVEDIRAL